MRIRKHLQGTFKDDKSEGLAILPSIKMTIDCYVNEKIFGLCGVEYYQDPFCIK